MTLYDVRQESPLRKLVLKMRSNAISWNPMEDERTKDIVARGATMGVFYVESPSMRQLQAKVGIVLALLNHNDFITAR